MLSCDFRHFFAASHAGELVDPFVVSYFANLRARPTALGLFAHDKMSVGESRDLRQMRDAKNLVFRREFRENAADTLGHRPADPGINLVEDDDHISICTAQRILDG